jgi:hypothetical protein
MNNENVSTPEAKLVEIEKILDNYQTRKGILALQSKNEAEKYLNLPQAEIRTLQADECFEAGIILCQYATFVQEAYNRELTRANWAESEIKRTVTKQMKQYNSPSADERRYLAIMGDEYTAKLDKLRMWAQALADRLSFMANRVDATARAYLSLAQHRRK